MNHRHDDADYPKDLTELIALLKDQKRETVSLHVTRLEREKILDPESQLLAFTTTVPTCSNPDCKKQEGGVFFVPGRKLIEHRMADPRIPDDERRAALVRIGVPIVVTLVSEHDDSATSVILTRDDARTMVNALTQAIAYAEEIENRGPLS